MSSRLPNYLRTYRKRVSLSQDEVAFLLGLDSGKTVCLYERSIRQPRLDIALAYEAILRTPIRELFKGVYQQVERRVAQRAAALSRRLSRPEPDRATARKLAALAGVRRKQ
jgi:DNA-binding XRE family transcriptional regulator